MNKNELVAALRQSPIWKEDSHGHFQKTFKGNKYRLKIHPLGVRFEKKVDTEWWCKTSDYYKNVEIKEGKLSMHGLFITLNFMPE